MTVFTKPPSLVTFLTQNVDKYNLFQTSSLNVRDVASFARDGHSRPDLTVMEMKDEHGTMANWMILLVEKPSEDLPDWAAQIVQDWTETLSAWDGEAILHVSYEYGVPQKMLED